MNKLARGVLASYSYDDDPEDFNPIEKIKFNGRNAYGFTNMLKRIPQGNGELLFLDIPAASSERDYYRLRRGDKRIPPSVQEQIISAVTQRGALPPLEFDKYIEEVEW